jgi:GT2 family glycosyltransferase
VQRGAPMEKPVPCLLIVGMHRSGTSLVAQACAAAGISPGPPAAMLAAQADNPEGFYEHRELVHLNDRFLEAHGAAWFAPPAEPLAAFPEALDPDAFLAGLGRDAGHQYLLKDPRLCLTLPAWLAHVEQPQLLYVYREPLAVARSLARRNRFPLQLGFLLWESYNRAALAAFAGRDVLAVNYDELLAQPRRLNQLAGSLAARGFNCSDTDLAALVNPALRHGAGDSAGRSLLTPAQRALEKQCLALCNDGVLPDEVTVMQVASQARLADLATAVAPLAEVVETGLRLEDAQALAAERTAERDKALAELQGLEQQHTALSEAHDAERALHARAAATLRTLTADHESLASAHAAERQAHEALQADHLHLAGLHDALLKSQAQLEADHAALNDKADYLFFALTEAFRGLLVFEHSFLARLQRHLRRAYRLLSGQRGRNSRYEDVLERAHEHFDEFGIDKPVAPPNKWTMAGDVMRYVWRNPAGSARSFSWHRLRRAAAVFFGSSSADLAVWVNARFPEASAAGETFDPAALGEDLDTLELDFPCSDAPRVSIVVPVYNNYRMTVNCLRSVHAHSAGVDYEIIIADDCSTDLTLSIGERLRGVRVSRSDENLRFLRNCNQAAAQARGEFILFLNNDTAVTEDWLERLLDAAGDEAWDETVGVVGPKLLFADGRLQEAGGIVWDDASAWNFGRADDPTLPAYNYRREVDYVSGACLMIRRSLWSDLGGFDERFAPAYYEDADICFAARAAGYRVVYQPESVVYHFEGVSNGTDLDAGVKQHQVTNQAVFLDKWRELLQREHFPNAQQVIHARDRSRHRPCVLVIDHYVPHHDRDAGGRSTYMYLKLLVARGCRVQFMGANFFPHQPYTRQLQAMGIEVLVGESIARHLDRWLAEHAPCIDEIFLHRPHVAEQFLPHLERLSPRPPISFFGHDLHYLRMQREAALKDDDALRAEAERWRRRELAVFERVDRVYYFSDIEIDALRGQTDTARLRRVPLYAMEIGELPPYAPGRPRDLLFVGGYNHPPNVDAALWLVEEILPRVRRELPDARLHLVGSNAREQVLALAGDAVEVHGYLSDEALDALYRQVGVAVVPLRYGAGVKGKVIEAIARNVPLVTTDIGAEGIPDAESVMWIENTADGIARCLVHILDRREDIAPRMQGYAAWLSAHFAADHAAQVLAAERRWLAPAQDSGVSSGAG